MALARSVVLVSAIRLPISRIDSRKEVTTYENVPFIRLVSLQTKIKR